MAAECNSCGVRLTFKAHHFYRGQDLCPTCLKSIEAQEQGAAPQESYAGTPAGPDWRVGLTSLGVLLGGLIGIVTRPSVFLVGQLPLPVVLTRGALLSGMDQILVPAAQSSFNHVVLCSLGGAIVGLVAGLFHWSANSRHGDVTAGTPVPDDGSLRRPPRADDEVLDNDAVLSMIGAGLGEDVIIEKIKHSKSRFALSTTDLTGLKTRGVSDRIMGRMIENQSRREGAPQS